MMSAEQALAVYQALVDLSGQMVAAASASDWDRVAELERHCAAQVQALRDGEGTLELSAPGRARKVEMIRQILADDRQIRELATPWMTRLSALINNTRAQSRLAGAYGAV
jgi:flagellar protein FliT